ncbi:MAG: phosphotransferase family protein [Actinomycetota bacterium]|nr:phosphotransferase family protein [Actinomycetota bacterium]
MTAVADLRTALERRIGRPVADLHRLSGGASRETWSFTAGPDRLILRRDPPGAARTGMLREAALLEAAAGVGVPVPELLDASDDVAVLGAAFLVMRHVDGETIPRKLLRDPAFADARPQLARQCGEVLARLHTLGPDAVPGLEETDQVSQYRSVLAAADQPHPAFELAFRWLDEHRPASTQRRIVHGDFRNGNLIVGPDGLRAVLDWELAHVGDPLEDLGWLCVKSWRFGVDLPVGGFGTYDDLVAGYGGEVDLESLRWWEVLGSLKWGIMCIMQALTHTSGAVRSVELAAIGRRVCEVEYDLLELVS